MLIRKSAPPHPAHSSTRYCLDVNFLTSLTPSPANRTREVAAMTIIQSVNDRGVTLNINPPKLTMIT